MFECSIMTKKDDGDEEQQKQPKKVPSRKRSRNPEEDKQSYYERLIYQCRKDLHKEAKRVKQFETQKLIRTYKKQQQKDGAKLTELKAYESLEPVIQECFRRLGILTLNPVESTSAPPVVASSSSCWITDRILQHKRMRDAIDKWHEEVTSYRRWCLKQQERQEQKGSNKKVATKKQQKFQQKSDTPEDMQQASVFVQLGHLPEEDGIGEDGRKKNRKGQRARRAKAIALEARRQGRVVTREESLNWRPKKRRDETDHLENNGAEEHKEEEEELLHPSWQARKEQKPSIVAFQGKKITF